MILKPITPATAASYKAVRLAALLDSPMAFGSTYAKESRFSEAQWAQRVMQWNGERSVCYLAWDQEEPCGIAAGFIDQDDPAEAHLVSMWVSPSHRRRGVGRLLVQGIIDWASGRARTLALMVTSSNDAATRFYECLGFRKTGRTEPYPNDASLEEFEMIYSLCEC